MCTADGSRSLKWKIICLKCAMDETDNKEFWAYAMHFLPPQCLLLLTFQQAPLDSIRVMLNTKIKRKGNN